MKQRWMWIIIAFLILAAIIGYRMYSRKNPDAVQAKADAMVTATDLIEAFEKDTSGAEKQYANKIIQVSGTVSSVDASGAVVFGKDATPSVVVIGLDQRHMADLQKITPGKPAVLQGIYSGYESGSNNPNDLLSGLGITIQLRSGGLKKIE
jgi:hypothetical protein